MRWRKLFKRSAIGLAVFAAAGLLTVAVLNHRAGSRLEARLAAIREAGEPATLAELTPAPIPADDNAAALVARNRTDMEAVERDLQVLYDENTRDTYSDGDDLTPAGAELVRSTLDRYPEIWTQLVQAAERPAYATQLDFAQSPSEIMEAQLKTLQLLRSSVRVLERRADLLCFDGQYEDACRTALVALRLARHFDQEPFVVSYLVSIAVRGVSLSMLQRALEAGPMGDQLRGELEKELASQDAMDGLVHSLRTDRVFGIAQFRRMPSSSMWSFKNDECAYLDLMAEEMRLGSQPAFKIMDESRQIEAGASGTLTQLIVPALQATRQAMDRIRAQMRCIRVANALQAAAASTGVAPESLDALDLPEDAKIDPFDGRPLRVKKTAEGWVIYSIGPNGQDDDGQTEKLEDVGVGPVPLTFAAESP